MFLNAADSGKEDTIHLDVSINSIASTHPAPSIEALTLLFYYLVDELPINL